MEPAETTTTFEVLWEHRFADGDREVRVNTITRELQFFALGDASSVKADPDMTTRVPTGETVIEIEHHDADLTVAGRFIPSGRRSWPWSGRRPVPTC